MCFSFAFLKTFVKYKNNICCYKCKQKTNEQKRHLDQQNRASREWNEKKTNGRTQILTWNYQYWILDCRITDIHQHHHQCRSSRTMPSDSLVVVSCAFDISNSNLAHNYISISFSGDFQLVLLSNRFEQRKNQNSDRSKKNRLYSPEHHFLRPL